jgi:H3 lysine-79-specific histone-lysine N-methyltransferase
MTSAAPLTRSFIEYLSPVQQARVGWSDTDLYLTDGAGAAPRPASPAPSSRPASVPASSRAPSSPASSLSSLSSPEPEPAPDDGPSLLRQLRRAIITRHGPAFARALGALNAALLDFKHGTHAPLDAATDAFAYSPPPPPVTALAARARDWDGVGVPPGVVARIMEETYQRAVGPRVKELRKYESWTSAVYGELTPRFVSELVRVARLAPGMRFLDLGSGVGNVVLQAALESGCSAFGIEIGARPAAIARGFLDQFERRCKMWGVRAGDVELAEGNMLESARVDELLPLADVVLVNNKVFLESCAPRPAFSVRPR